MKSIKELRKNNKKGFTLVELIVVLVILAILATLLIPTLTGYIDKAKEKDVIAQTRQTVMATQTLVDEKYGIKETGTSVTVEKNVDGAKGLTKYDVTEQNIKDLAEVTGNIVSVRVTDSGKVTGLVYSNKGKYCKYDSTADENYVAGSATYTLSATSTSNTISGQ